MRAGAGRLVEKAQIVATLRTALEGRCSTCGRVCATEHEWVTTSGGERPDLCWEDSPDSCPWRGLVDLDEVRADAILRVSSPGAPS